MDERVALEMQLQWDAAAPCRWRWKLHLTWDVMLPCGRCLRVASYEATLGSATRVGIPPVKGRVRQHNVLRGISAYPWTLRQMDETGVCWCGRTLGNLKYVQVSTAGGALRMISPYHEPIIEWVLPHEAFCVMELVGALL